MTNKELATKAMEMATKYKTLYVLGCFGAPLNASNKQRYTSNYSYNAGRKSMINAASADTFGFDCVCLIKGILWGWNGDKNATYGGAKYASNGVPDIDANTMISKCNGVSTDFSKIEVGEVVWMSDHIGIYIGDGLAVECTPRWDNKVQITACNCTKSGYNRRNWTKHGKLPYITYEATTTTTPTQQTTTQQTTQTGIKTYTKAQASTKLSTNFTVSEFAIKDVNYPCKVDMSLIDKLQKIRNYFGQPVHITSGYRCTSYNAQIGGASNSYHTKGQAVDMYIKGLDPEFVGLYAQVVLGLKGIGIYHDDMFCHLDTRTSKFYWRNQSCTNQGSSFFGSYIGANTNKYSVKVLQTLLNRRGFNCGTVDGIYGAKTTAAVKAAQTKYKLTVDGLAGTQTLKALYGSKW